MKYYCKCDIPLGSEAECKYRVEVYKFRTYLSGATRTDTNKCADTSEFYCNYGAYYCPNQKIIEIKEEEKQAAIKHNLLSNRIDDIEALPKRGNIVLDKEEEKQ